MKKAFVKRPLYIVRIFICIKRSVRDRLIIIIAFAIECPSSLASDEIFNYRQND